MGGRSADSSPACARPGVHWGRNGRPSTVSVVRIAGAPRRAVHGAKEQCGGALHPPQSSVRVGTLPADGSQPRLPPDESVQDGARGVDDRRAVESRYDREGLVLVLVPTPNLIDYATIQIRQAPTPARRRRSIQAPSPSGFVGVSVS